MVPTAGGLLHTQFTHLFPIIPVLCLSTIHLHTTKLQILSLAQWGPSIYSSLVWGSHENLKWHKIRHNHFVLTHCSNLLFRKLKCESKRMEILFIFSLFIFISDNCLSMRNSNLYRWNLSNLIVDDNTVVGNCSISANNLAKLGLLKWTS